MKLPLWAKILLGLVIVAIGWGVLYTREEAVHIRELADLPACRLAADYMEWRLTFEDEHPEEELTEAEASAFAGESEVYEQAVRRALDDSPSQLLEELATLTAVDSTRWVREEGNFEPFVQIMLLECPAEVEELVSRGQR
jgi:hypothetical protein